MFYQSSISQQLRAHYNRVANARMATYNMHLANLARYISGTPYLAALVAGLAAAYPDAMWDPSAEFGFTRRFSMPTDPGAGAKYVWEMIDACVNKGYAELPWQIGYEIGAPHDTDAALHAFATTLVSILVEYLDDQLIEGGIVLYLLEKYRRRIGFFRREELFARMAADTGKSEEIVDRDLREYLFDQGVNYPFSQPASDSGYADIVADVGEERPLVLEIKLFDPGRGYDRAYIAKGFRQALSYADDYGQTVGFLSVFNCTSQRLIIPSDAADSLWPPRIQVGHVTIFVVVIDVYVWQESASRRPAIRQYVIERNNLVPEPE